MKRLLLFVALCTVCVAFTPRKPRALNEEEAPSSSSAPLPDHTICAPETPCAWITYNPVNRVIESRISNTYCLCAADKACKATQDDKAMSVFTLYCKEPEYDDTDLLNS